MTVHSLDTQSLLTFDRAALAASVSAGPLSSTAPVRRTLEAPTSGGMAQLFGLSRPEQSALAKIQTNLRSAKRMTDRFGIAISRAKRSTAQRNAKQLLSHVTRAIEDRRCELDLQIDRNPGAAGAAKAERQALFGALNDYAGICNKLGEYGLETMQDLAEALYGGNAVVLERGPGVFQLWNNSDELRSAMIAHLPTPTALDKDSFHVDKLPRPPAIGAHAFDKTVLTTSNKLTHLSRALGTAVMSVSELFDPEKIGFGTAPDMSRELNAMHQANADRAADADAVPLSVLTYNVAMLEYKLFGFYTHKKSPLIAERRGILANEIFSGQDDVIMLQEVWRDEDVKMFSRVAAERGYRVFVSPRTKYNDGLMTFVKESAIDDTQPVAHRAKAYESQQAKEWWAAEATSLFFAVGVKRGYEHVGFHHPQLGKVELFNTHKQAFPELEGAMGRLSQGREIGLAVRSETNDRDLVLLGGDLNAGPFYKADTWTDGKGKTSRHWWKNAISYPATLHYMGGTDLVVAGRSAAEADYDVEIGKLPQQAGDNPMYPFTASARSNELYHRQYARSEYRARLDHLFGRDNGRVKVLRSNMAFTEDVQVTPSIKTELSDHYGVRSKMLVNRPK